MIIKSRARFGVSKELKGLVSGGGRFGGRLPNRRKVLALRALPSLLSHSELTVLEGSSGSDDGSVVSVVPEVI